MSGVGIGTFQLAMMAEMQGRLAEVEPFLRTYRAMHPGIRELHALALARTGDTDRLRLELGPWAEQPPVAENWMWTLVMAVRTEVWSVLGDQEAAAGLHDRLTPYADRLAISVPIGFFGALALARLRWLIVPAALLASVAIEAAQASRIPGRFGTPRDVIANVLGALAGYLLAVLVLRFLRRRSMRKSAVTAAVPSR